MSVRSSKTRKTYAPSTALIALGGHAFMQRGELGTHEQHLENARSICEQLMTLVERFDGGPVGLETLAAAVGEDKGTLEDVVEPYLIHEGFLARTPRGRVATRRARAHLGLPEAPSGHPSQPKLL